LSHFKESKQIKLRTHKTALSTNKDETLKGERKKKSHLKNDKSKTSTSETMTVSVKF
jgi:hypothetical protein